MNMSSQHILNTLDTFSVALLIIYELYNFVMSYVTCVMPKTPLLSYKSKTRKTI